MMVSCFLPLGPLGTSSLAFLQLGSVAPAAFAGVAVLGGALGGYLQGFGLVVGMLLWGHALWWLVVAVLSVCTVLTSLPFNMGW